MQSQTGYTKQLKRINNKIMKQEQNITLRNYKSSSNKTIGNSRKIIIRDDKAKQVPYGNKLKNKNKISHCGNSSKIQ